MFERAHHLRIASVLQALDAETISGCGCLFGGGTAIVLTHGEYRESADIDFLVSSQDGYRDLRSRMKGSKGIRAITRSGTSLVLAREVRADQYGIRTMLAVGGVQLKLEFNFESRVSLERDPAMRVCGVEALTPLDMATTKLLASSDRWADDSVFSRDLIDLAMLNANGKLRAQALKKAKGAYGVSVERDLAKAIVRLRERRGRLDECMHAMRMDAVPKAVLWGRIRKWLPARSPSRKSAT